MHRYLIYIILFNTLFFQHVFADSFEQDVFDRVDKIRAITITNDKARLDSYNKLLDSNWQFFTDNKQKVLPVLRKVLDKELKASKPSDMVLLDLGSFVYLSDSAEDKNLSVDALLKINPDNEIIKRNFQQFFRFSHMAAISHGEKILPMLDEVFLTTDANVFIAQHVMNLDATLMSVFLYGVISDNIDMYLVKQLADSKKRLRVLEVLNWLGSEKSVPGVNRLLNNKIDDATFQRMLGMNMRLGGQLGKHAMLNLDVNKLPDATRQNIRKIQESIKKQNYEKIYDMIKKMSEGAEIINDKDLLKRMDAMIDSGRMDNNASALSLFVSKIDKETLITKLKKQRSHILRRLSDEALSEVEVINLIINGLQYKK